MTWSTPSNPHGSSPPGRPPPASVLLGRPEFVGDLQLAAAFVRGRRVLVTGAAGSLGSPLAQVLLAAEPASLVLVDHHEYSLFSLERALGAARPGLSYEFVDVSDVQRLRAIFDAHGPDIIVHLAAAKHVPYGERFPEAAVATNVLATHSLLDLCHTAGVETFVYPSSDKSVQPPSVYGATKRIAEALIQFQLQLHSPAASAGRSRWAVVRYVNIIGTRGSVVETFTQQVQANRSLSVTDARMTRYWISMDEALWCVLMAAGRAANGQVVIPACGEPVPLLETARRLAGWYRPERVPYPITCTGIRPGERLHEALLSSNESFGEGPALGLRAVHTRRHSGLLLQLPGIVDQLRRLAAAGDRDALVRMCLEAAEALQ